MNSVRTEEENSDMYDTVHTLNNSAGKTPFESSKLTVEKSNQSKLLTETARHVKLNLSPARFYKKANSI